MKKVALCLGQMHMKEESKNGTFLFCAKGNVEGTVGGRLHNSKTCQPPSLSIAVELHSHHDHKVITINIDCIKSKHSKLAV